jgi:hypothetical protein
MQLDAGVRRSSVLYGGRGGPDYPGLRTAEEKLRGTGNIKTLRLC